MKKSLVRLLLLPFTTLRGRLLLGTLVLWSLICIIFLSFGWYSGRYLVSETNHQHLRYEAVLIRNAITFQVNDRLDALHNLSQSIQMSLDGQLDDSIAEPLGSLFDALIVFDLQSQVVDEWPNDGGRSGNVFADRDYARFMHAFQTSHVSQPLIDRITNKPMVLMLVPLYNAEGGYTGFLGGLVNIEQSNFFKNFNHLRLGDAGYVTITTAAGQRIYSPYQQEAIETLADPISPVFQQALDGWEGEGMEESSSGQPELVAYRQIWPANWVVGVHLPQSQAKAPLNSMVQRTSIYAWGLLILILPVTGGIIWLTLRPLLLLGRQVRDLQENKRVLLDIPTRMNELRQVIDVINDTESARQTSMRTLAEREALLHETLSASPLGMFVTDGQGHHTFINDALRKLWKGNMPQSVKEWSERVYPEDRQDVLEAWLHSIEQKTNFSRQFRFLGPDHELYWLDVQTAAVLVNKEFIGTVGTVRDITQHQNDYAQKHWESEHDPLTGLLNRRGLIRHVEEAFIDWQNTGKPTVVLAFDLDKFKSVNDQGGHAVGDQLLQQVAAIIKNEIRSSDHAARQGGDEFTVLLPGCTPIRALSIAESLRASIAANPVVSGDQQWQVTASIGISDFRQGDNTFQDVLKRADAASYRAKQKGRNKVEADDEAP